MEPVDRWSRGCGSGGLGFSGHINQLDYKNGVLMGNWNEEKAQQALAGKHVLDYGVAFQGNATTASTFTPAGKYGEDMLALQEGPVDAASKLRVRNDVMTFHGDPHQPSANFHASLNSLTYGEKVVGEPRVQQYLWNGSKSNDMLVPKTSLHHQEQVNTQRGKWRQEHEAQDPYVTTSRAAAISAAIPAATGDVKRATMRPMADGGQPAQMGRRPKGEMVAHFEKTHLKTGLRC